MNVKERLRARIESSRELSERLLADFHTPEDWVHQVHPGTNHALWFAGHMAQTDNFFISLTAPDRVREFSPEWQKAFGMGSHPVADPAAYPPVEEVLEAMRERRAVLLEVLEATPEDALNQPTPEGTPSFLPDGMSVFETASWHEGMHSGQLTLVRRSLGHEPVMGG